MIQTRTDKVGLGVSAGPASTYTYDGAGHRTGVTTAGATGANTTASTPSASTSFGYNAASELASKNSSATGWAYDA